MNTQSHADVMDAHGIYYRTYLDGKHFFLYTFRQPPSIVWLDQVDKEKLLVYVKRQYKDSIRGIY